ncbi:MAG TPA: zinc ABC transporter substrate-binding protein [Candidatus Dormibacteraeota bacterium]|nr:zinc ABC transporter substrate-binding protein [Candidatus Dormibacteraeota bacterium]
MAGWATLVVLVLAAGLVACGGVGAVPSGVINVVAAENFWGSIAAQLGGTRVSVQSSVSDPNADPHEYESSAADARAFAEAGLVILNGAGYDDWGQKLIDAGPAGGRLVLNVAAALGKKPGDNPHFWYDPESVVLTADRITADYKSIDSRDAAYFDQMRSGLTAALRPYHDEVGVIKQRYSGAPIGSTEAVFVYMAAALGLRLTTPAAFMNAVSQGIDPPASAVVEVQDQVSSNGIRALVYNSQTATAVTTNVRALAASHHIPTVAVTETLQPPDGRFEDWQLEQLRNLEAALSASS